MQCPLLEVPLYNGRQDYAPVIILVMRSEITHNTTDASAVTYDLGRNCIHLAVVAKGSDKDFKNMLNTLSHNVNDRSVCKYLVCCVHE